MPIISYFVAIMRKGAIIVFVSAFLAASCQLFAPSEPAPVQPAGYSSFHFAFSTGYKYSSAEVQSNIIVVTFDGAARAAFTARMNIEGIIVDDCSDSCPRPCTVGPDGNWTVGGVPTKIKCNTDLDDSEAIPFYITYGKKKELRICISNGNTLVFQCLNPQFFGSIPKVYLTTDDKSPIKSKKEYKHGRIVIKDPDHKFWDNDEFSAPARLRGRGNSTWDMPKKPYKIKLDESARLFDMSTDKEWCLLANYCDKSLLRNLTAMEISKRLGFKWTPEMVPVELYFNGIYDGVYNFSEHKKVSKERVNINLDAGDILFEIEQNLDEPVCWVTDHGCPIMFSEPSEPSQEQIEFAKSFFKSFEENLWAKNFDEVYRTYIDKSSFIDNFIIQELTKNVDGNLRKSTFLTLEKGGRLEMYHVWDFDISMGNCDYYYDGVQTWEGWWIKDQGANGRYHGWYYRLFMDPGFVKDVKARWREVYPLLETIPEWIEDEIKILGDAPERNFKRWNILNTYVWPNAKVTGSYKGETDWLLQNYTRRLAWLNTRILAL